MKSRVLYFILIMAVLVGCTKESEPALDQVINQNEININQLKEVAVNSGWKVSSKVEEGDRTIPLTETEIKNFYQSLDELLVYPNIQENRKVEIFPIGNYYTWKLPFLSLSTKSTSSGTMYGTASYGDCGFSACDFKVGVKFDLTDGCITYAFSGADDLIWDLGRLVAFHYVSVYDECTWTCSTIEVVVYINYIKERYSKVEDFNWPESGKTRGPFSTSKQSIIVRGTFNIEKGQSDLVTTWVADGGWSPIDITK